MHKTGSTILNLYALLLRCKAPSFGKPKKRVVTKNVTTLNKTSSIGAHVRINSWISLNRCCVMHAGQLACVKLDPEPFLTTIIWWYTYVVVQLINQEIHKELCHVCLDPTHRLIVLLIIILPRPNEWSTGFVEVTYAYVKRDMNCKHSLRWYANYIQTRSSVYLISTCKGLNSWNIDINWIINSGTL